MKDHTVFSRRAFFVYVSSRGGGGEGNNKVIDIIVLPKLT